MSLLECDLFENELFDFSVFEDPFTDEEMNTISTESDVPVEESNRKRKAISSSEPIDEKLQCRLNLLRAPRQLCEAANSGSVSRIRKVVNDISSPNCILVTPSLPEEGIIGREHITKFFEAMMDVHPDILFVCKPSKLSLDERLITAKYIFSGTKQFPHANDILFDTLKTGLRHDAQYEGVVQKIEDDGGHVKIFGKGGFEFELDSTLSTVVKASILWRIVNVEEAYAVDD